jgi:hypothetical protein
MDSENNWSVATAEDDGKPLIIRIRNQPPVFADKKALPQMLAVSWQYEPPNKQGMPSQEAAERMSQLEDLLGLAFEEAGQAFLTVVVTGNGVREWQWYVRDAEAIMAIVNEVLGEHEPFPVEFSFEMDPEWAAYSRFLEITG